jgi:hypothetical protein
VPWATPSIRCLLKSAGPFIAVASVPEGVEKVRRLPDGHRSIRLFRTASFPGGVEKV